MATNPTSLYDFLADLQNEFGGEITPSDESDLKGFLDFYVANPRGKKTSNPGNQRAIELNVLRHDDGFAIVVDDHTLEIVSNEFSVKTVEEAIRQIHLELGN